MSQLIPLTSAAVRLRKSYNVTQRLVMVGELTGQRDESGRWWVDESDIERFISETPALARTRSAVRSAP